MIDTNAHKDREICTPYILYSLTYNYTYAQHTHIRACVYVCMCDYQLYLLTEEV